MAPKTNQAGAKPTAKYDAVGELKTGRDATVKVPQWDRYVAAGEAKDGGSFGEALDKHDGPQWASACREVFSKMYGANGQGGPAQISGEERPEGSEWVEKIHDNLETLPEWRAMKERARRDAWSCGIAAGELMKTVADQVQPPKVDPQGIADELDLLKDMMAETGSTSPQHLKRMAALQRELQTAKQDMSAATKLLGQKAASLRSAMRRGAMQANEKIQEMDEAMTGLNAGEGTGIASRVAVPPAQLRKALSDNGKLRRIAKLAGRMKHAAIYKQRTKAKIGREEICDVTAGNDLTRLLPVELGALADENTEALLYRRLMEGAALQYDMRGKETKGEGPIILCVDESGSMSGAPDEWAKAVVFGLLEIGARQKRPVYLCHGDYRVTRTDEFREPRNITLPAIVDAVTYFTGGGTCIAEWLKHAGDLLDANEGPWKRADVILVTDGEDYQGEAQLAQIRRIKNRGGHLYTVCIGCEPGGVLKAESDDVIHLCSEDIEKGDTTKIGAVFSI